MTRHGVAGLILLGLTSAAARPDEPPPAKGGPAEKVEALTEAKLVGRWAAANGSVVVNFSAKEKGDDIAIAVLVLKAGGAVSVGSVGYKIDAAKNEVRFPDPHNGLATATKDGALEFSGTYTFGGNTYTVPKTLLVRSKADAPKK